MAKRGGKKPAKIGKKKGSDTTHKYDENQPILGSDDEEISEDGAFNSEDEREFGDYFAQKKVRDEIDDDELAGDENEPTLLDMMDDNDENGGPRRPVSSDDDQEEGSSDDDDDDDDEANEEEDSSEEDEDDDSDDEGGMEKFREMINQLSEKGSKKERAALLIKQANKKVSNDGEGGGHGIDDKKQKLTLDALMKSLGTTAKYGTLKKRLEKLEEVDRIKQPGARIVEERAERKVGYETSKKEIKKWIPVVQKNRQADSLSFPLNEPERIRATTSTIAASFQPEQDLEREIAQVLEASGMGTEEKIKETEEKHLLEVSKVDMEQMKERQSELAKLRALMFYEEQKAKRQKKIKSKIYRRLKKRREAREEEKERAKLAEVDPEAAKLLEEKAAVDRAAERMSLRHKNTSKFIRGLLKSGGSKKDYVKKIVNEQLELGNRLKQKIRTIHDDSDDDSDDDDDELREPDQDAQTLLKQIEAEKQAAVPKGLMGMKFMQRSLEKQRETAKASTEALLRAIKEGRITDDGEIIEEGDDEKNGQTQNIGRRKFGLVAKDGPGAGQTGENKDEEDKFDYEDDDDDEENNVETRKRLRAEARTSAAVNVAVPATKAKRKKLFETPAFEIPNIQEEERPSSKKNNIKQQQQKTKQDNKETVNIVTKSQKAGDDEDDEDAQDINPWLEKNARHKKQRNDDNDDDQVRVDVAKSTKELVEQRPKKKNSQDGDEDKKEKEDKRRKKEQADLIRRAFAGTDALGKDFEEQKEEAERLDEEREAMKNAKLQDKPGWGSWAGAGIAPKKKKKRPAEEAAAAAAAARKKQRANNAPRHVVVSEQRNRLASNYQVADVPYPFTSREQYENSLRNPLGNDWNTTNTFNKLVKPAVITRAGTIIDPIELPSKKSASEE